jgi:Mn2+/Fe2+ NRAMP family transporter
MTPLSDEPARARSTQALPNPDLGAPPWRKIAWAIGPGIVVMLADTDAGNVVTAAQAGAQWRYRLLPLVLALIPMLYMIQELTVRLGIFTGRGHAELIRERFGRGWAWLSVTGLAIATIGSLVTEFSAVAGIGELYGLSRGLTLVASAAILLAVVLTGTYRRVERIAIVIGLFECAFFAVAWTARPDLRTLVGDAIKLPLGNSVFLYLVAAIIGATFNPWMVFYQQSAIADKRLRLEDYKVARWDTAAGAVLTQLLTGAVLVAAAATLGAQGSSTGLESVGAISEALTPVLGGTAGRLVFSAGVLGAAMVAAIVSSLALAWGLGEVAGYRRSLENHPLQAPWFYGIYAVFLVASTMLVGMIGNLVWLNVAAQVVNVFLLPLVIGFLVVLSLKTLPAALRPRGWYLVVLLALSSAVCAVGWIGGLAGLPQPRW